MDAEVFFLAYTKREKICYISRPTGIHFNKEDKPSKSMSNQSPN